MAKTYATILDDIETLLQDAGVDPSAPAANSVFATAEIDALMPMALVAISQFKPWNPLKLTKTTTADSFDITLSAGDKWREIQGTGYNGTSIQKIEYLVDKNPRQFRGLTRFGDIISLELDSRPSSAVSVYLFMNKIHMLQKQIGTTDTAGAIKTLAAAAATSLELKALGSGTIDEMTTIAIAGDSTVYYVTAQATITTNEATVSIWPPLAASAAVDAVVTLSLTGSTLDMVLEGYLARWLAAMACISKATKSYAQVNTAITTIANAATAIAAIAARITQGVADVASGRTAAALGVTAIALIAARITQGVADFASGRVEAAKVSAILDTANTEIDKILVLLDATSGAQKDVADGRTELVKVPALATAAGTAIALVAARITQALTDIASARTAIALGVTALTSANTEVGLINTEVDLAKTALSSGNSLINTVTVGGGAPEYMGQANADVNVAQGYLISGQGYIQKASGDFNNANADFIEASRELEAGAMRIREAQANLEQANADIVANRGYIETATAKLRVAQGYFQEAQGYVMEANTRMANNAAYIQLGMGELSAAGRKAEEAAADHANANTYYGAAAQELRAAAVKAQEAVTNLNLVATRLQVSAGGLRYEQWGKEQLALVERDLRSYNGFPHSVRYPRD